MTRSLTPAQAQKELDAILAEMERAGAVPRRAARRIRRIVEALTNPLTYARFQTKEKPSGPEGLSNRSPESDQ